MAKVGDTVRFLNAVGGGTIVRIDGQIAYVDEDGFETPALLRECVVVSSGDSFYKRAEAPKPPQAAAPKSVAPEPKEEILPPVEETAEGEKLNLVIGFEPSDIKRLSNSSFDAYLVNDSNYALFVAVATRPAGAEKWKLRFSGTVEPAIQEFLFELTSEDLSEIGHISVHAVAYKAGSEFTLKSPVAYEHRLDATRFVRLHCFDSNPYFDSKVLALDIVKDDVVVSHMQIDASRLQQAISEKSKAEKPKRQKVSKPAQRPAFIEVDLHASALLDNLNGLSKADILNYQVDTFRKVMDENLPFPGTKIIFIHGKGEGVLRNALMKELNYRYKGHEVADASFREYGFGATQVTIRKKPAQD